MLSDTSLDALEANLSELLIQYDGRSDTNAVQFALASPSRSWHWTWFSANAPRQYFIASTTKLFVTALVMQLRAADLLKLDEAASDYLDPSVMSGIHIFKGTDYSDRITVRELLSHTSGIADYFEQKRKDGATQIGQAIDNDFAWTFDDVIRITRDELKPSFKPSASGKAFYSDTNFQLLCRIIEAVTKRSYEEAVEQRIIEPIGLNDTYPFTLDTIDRYDSVAPMLYGKHVVRIPQAMASVRADGGIVSSATDGIKFLQAFMTGELFPAHYVSECQAQWNAVFRPLEYGMGIMRFALPRYYTLFRKAPVMIGHSGASGAVLFYVPEIDLYVSGTVNQIKKRNLSYTLMTRIVMACQDAF